MDAGMRREHLYSDSGIEKPEKRKKKKAKKTLTTMTRICSQCGGTEFASGHKVSVECVVDGTGRLIRLLETNNEEAREVCRSGMAAGPFVCLSYGCEGKTLEEITVVKEHPVIDVCLIEKPVECGLNGVDISRMMSKLGEKEVYPVEFLRQSMKVAQWASSLKNVQRFLNMIIRNWHNT